MAEMSDTLFAWAEPGLREYKSARLLIDYLRENGFDVEEGVSWDSQPWDRMAFWTKRRAAAETYAHLTYLRNMERVAERRRDGILEYEAA